MEYEDKLQMNRMEKALELLLEKVRPDIFEDEEEPKKK